MCMRVVDKKLYPCRLTVFQQTVTTHKQPKAQLCTSSRRIDPLWGENGSHLYSSNELTLMLRFISHAHLCSEYFAECDFVNFMEYQMGLLQSGICRGVHRVTDTEKFPVRISKASWRAASAQHDTKNWEAHWYPETSANKAKTKV